MSKLKRDTVWVVIFERDDYGDGLIVLEWVELLRSNIGKIYKETTVSIHETFTAAKRAALKLIRKQIKKEKNKKKSRLLKEHLYYLEKIKNGCDCD